MTSGETLPRGNANHDTRGNANHDKGASEGAGQAEAGTVTGVVVVAHGGQSLSTQPTNAFQPAVLRMVPIAAAIRHGLRGSGAIVRRPRFRLRGWNDAQASPVGDLTEVLDEIAALYGSAPVVLVGHSMGARAAMRAAGHPAVSAVAGLAPWLPLGEPVDHLAGRRVLVAHGSADGITSPSETWAFVDRARAVTGVTAIEVRDGDHPMLRRARLWHAIAAEFARAALGLEAGPLTAAVTWTAPDPPRTIL
jgi:pimeloyl-ACP methyl ester carboxylesterase